jgi:tetratricopeptide (TPR) repeat protein
MDFSDYIAYRTERFTGREWAFHAINNWLAGSEVSRFFILSGEPGSGKTAVAGRLEQFSRGEIRPPENLTYLTHNFLSAVHFCSARDRLWIDPRAFAKSLALQLANRYSAYAEALAENSGNQQIRIEVDQQVQHMEGGEVSGVVIKNLEIRGGSAEDGFIRLVREPLEALFQGGHDEQVVILVDALDEALLYSGEAGIVPLLAHVEYLPAKVRFIVTSRPEVEVMRPLRRLRPEPQECSLTAGTGLSQSLKDVKRFAWRALDEQPQLADKLAPDQSQQDFAAAVQERSEGNFLYVRYLLQMLISPQQETISRTSLEQLPVGLDGIYVEFLERLVGDDEEAWQEKYAPVAGTLAVAQQALSEARLVTFVAMSRSEVRQVLKDLRQFLETDDSLPPSQRTYAIYHRSFSDFLLDEDRSEEYWCEEQEQHRRIVEYYRKDATSGGKVDWSQVDGYGLRYLAYHLHEARYKQDLYTLLTGSPDWMNRKFMAFSDNTPFVTDLQLALGGFSDQGLPDEVPTLVALYTAWQVVNAHVTNYTDSALRALVWLRRENEALAHMRLRRDAQGRFQGLLTIYDALKEGGRETSSLLRDAQEIANTIVDSFEQAMALTSLVSAMVQEGSYEEARKVVDNMPEPHRPRALSGLARVLARDGHYEEAREVAYNIAKVPNEWDKVMALGDLAQGLAREKRYEEALEAARIIEVDWRRAEVLGHVVVPMIKQGAYDHATLLLEETLEVALGISNEGKRSEVLSNLVGTLAQGGGYEEAMEVTRLIEQDGDRARALSDLAAAVAQAGDEDRASALFDEALEIAHEISRHDLSRQEALGDVASALTRAGRYEKAGSVANELTPFSFYGMDLAAVLSGLAEALVRTGRFEEARETAYAIPDDRDRARALSDLAAAVAQAGDEDRASALFDEALEVAPDIPEEGKRWKALGAVVRALAQAGCYEEAVTAVRNVTQGSQWEEVVRQGWNWAEVLQDVAVALAGAGRYEEAKEIANSVPDDWLAQILRQDPHPYWNKAGTLGAVASALATAGHFEQAREVAYSIPNLLEKEEALGELVAALIKSGRYEGAREVANELPDNEKWAWIPRAEVNAIAQEGRYEEAMEVASKLPEGEQRADALSSLARSLTQAGRYDEAREVAYKISFDFSRAEALRALMNALSQEGRYEEATDVASELSAGESKARALSDLAAAVAQAGDDDRASALFDEALEVVHKLSSFTLGKRFALSSLVDALARTGRYDEAKKAAQSVSEDQDRGDALASVVRALAQVGRYEDAIEVASELPDGERWAWDLRDLVTKLAEAGHYKEARRIAYNVPGEWPRTQTLSSLARVLAQEGLYEEARKVASELPEIKQRAMTLSVIASVLAQEGLYEKAKEVAYTISDDWRVNQWRVQALGTVIKALAREERYEEVMADIRSFAHGWQWEEILRDVAVAVAEAGHYEEVREIAYYVSDDERLKMLTRVASALAQARLFNQALAMLNDFELDDFLHALAQCAPSFDQVKVGLASVVLRECTRVAGWVRSDWRKVDQALSQSGQVSSS